MKVKVREIFLSWRKGKGGRRNIIGVLKRTATNGITFKYLKEGSEKAKLEGFKEYPGFPLNYENIYQENDLDVFSLRLIPFERKDNLLLLDFWEAAGCSDKFDLLALTQGLLPTDNFEFLGLYNPKKDFKFVTDLAGLSHLSLERGSIQVNDILNYEIESNEFAFNKIAVKIYKGNKHIGYIKNVHNNIFIRTTKRIKLKVKEVEQNGVIKNIFVLVNSRF